MNDEFLDILKDFERPYEAYLEKIVAQRVQNLLKDPQLFEVWRTFGAEVFRRSSVLYGLEDFLKEIVPIQIETHVAPFGYIEKYPETYRATFGYIEKHPLYNACLEIGTCNGLTAIVLSRYFGHVYSIDIHPSNSKRKIVEHLGIKNITFLEALATNDLEETMDRRDEIIRSYEGRYQFAFVDGDHAGYSGRDFRLVEHCKRVLFDEAWKPQPGVWSLVNSLPASQVRFGGFRFAYWKGSEW